MDFKIELMEFPSEVHSQIYIFARRILPLSRTLVAVQDFEMREACVALHSFIMDMLSDMYDNPEAYYLPVMKWEWLVVGKPIASQYFGFLRWLGQRGSIEGDTLVISKEDLQDVSKKFSTSTSSIKLEKRLEALSRVGLTAEVLPAGSYRIFSKNHPGMFLAFNALPQDNSSLLDFRGIDNKYKPAYDQARYPVRVYR